MITLDTEILGENIRKSLKEFYMKTFELEFNTDVKNSKIDIKSDFVTAKVPLITNLTLNIAENISGSKTYKLIIKSNILELSIPVEKVSSNLKIESQRVEKDIEEYCNELNSQVRQIVESYRSNNR